MPGNVTDLTSLTTILKMYVYVFLKLFGLSLAEGFFKDLSTSNLLSYRQHGFGKELCTHDLGY